MEGIRTVGPAAGFRWLRDAINIGRRGAFAVFGGAAILLLVGVLAGIAFGIVTGGAVAAFRTSTTVSFLLGLSFVIPMLLWMALGFVGYLRLIDAVESGRAAKAADMPVKAGPPALHRRGREWYFGRRTGGEPCKSLRSWRHWRSHSRGPARRPYSLPNKRRRWTG